MRIWLAIPAMFLWSITWADTVIHAGKMVDASSGDVREAVTMVVDGERIKSVETGYQGTADIDLTDASKPSSCQAGSTWTCKF